ncbi:hypothetical protein CHS0354_036368 [Potamilus streckersoni]|uniref:Uncharacterized protein n=1 Tax=Potamilus streckersoni TaxID=2493646 RepID=A0AAE0W0L9_9BIVA|nr:hypothetical protein CHS0354_036368 [Potamilus streckersoni]
MIFAALNQKDYSSQAQTVTHPTISSISLPEYLGKKSGTSLPDVSKAVSIITEWQRLNFNITGENNSSYVSREKNQSKTRRRRYEYEDTYDWDQSGLDYDIPKKENLMDKIVKNWQKVALKCIFLFCFLTTLICCCVGVCRKCFQHCWRSCLSHVRYYCDLFRCGDPGGSSGVKLLARAAWLSSVQRIMRHEKQLTGKQYDSDIAASLRMLPGLSNRKYLEEQFVYALKLLLTRIQVG